MYFHYPRILNILIKIISFSNVSSSHLNVDGMTIFFNSTKELCIVCRLHVKLDNFVLTLFPYLNKDKLFNWISMIHHTLSNLDCAALKVARVILHSGELIWSTSNVSFAALDFQYSSSSWGPSLSFSTLKISLSRISSCMTIIHC